MSAFNGRLRAKRWFGLPAVAVVAALATLPAATLSALVETPWLAWPFAAAACAGAAAAALALVLGDELAFVPIMLAARAEREDVTAEVGR